MLVLAIGPQLFRQICVSCKKLLRLQLGDSMDYDFASDEHKQHHVGEVEKAVNENVGFVLKMSPQAFTFGSLTSKIMSKINLKRIISQQCSKITGAILVAKPNQVYEGVDCMSVICYITTRWHAFMQ